MNKFIVDQPYKLENELVKYLLLHGDQLFLSAKNHGPEVADWVKSSEATGFSRSIEVIKLSDVTSLEQKDGEGIVTVHHTNNGKSKKQAIKLNDEHLARTFAEHTASTRNFSLHSQAQSGLKKAIVPALIFLLCLWLGISSIMGDADLSTGTSRRGGLVRLISGILGPTLTGILLLLVAVGAAWYSYTSYANPGEEHVWR